MREALVATPKMHWGAWRSDLCNRLLRATNEYRAGLIEQFAKIKRKWVDRHVDAERDVDEVPSDTATYPVQIPRRVDVRGIRHRLGLSQNEFVARYGIPIGTLRDWEQGRVQPDTATRALLMAIDGDPGGVARALRRPRE